MFPIVTGLSNVVAVPTVHSMLLTRLTEVDTVLPSQTRLSAYYTGSTQSTQDEDIHTRLP